jgi:thioredoxin
VGAIKDTTDATFEADGLQNDKPVLVDFWAPWCPPCRVVAPAVERLSRELAGTLKVAKVNTDLAPALQNRFRVFSIPTLVLVEGGRERDRVVGAQGAASLRRWLEARLTAPISE